MKKGYLHITPSGMRSVPGKPYRPATYSRQADASRIRVEDQAREYALWLMKNGKARAYVYPMPRSGRGAAVDAREALLGFHRGPLELVEVTD